eukprot:gb/GEZN01012139.1/.p1 GENE.gb/GEZN01012139.1/~~gb/GEZN01012139.1/.p1  ORF type:complete len:283 (-),score=42.37 gb/GEZN01012139.1/:220-1068(-)
MASFLPDEAWRLSHLSHAEIKEVAMTMLTTAIRDSCLFYLTFFYIFILPLSRSLFGYGKHYETHKPFWKKVMKAYNILMSLFSFLIFLAGARALYITPIRTEDCGLFMRDPVWNYAVYAFYISKYVEYADTFFIYLMNKPVSFLQWFHHIGAAASLYLFYWYNAETAWIFTVFNSFIHTIMYYYFSLTVTTTDPKLKKKLNAFRPMMTAMQLVQFFSGCYICYSYRKVLCLTSDPALFIASYYFPYCYVYMLVVLFAHFFIKEYVCPKKSMKAVKSFHYKEQ